LFGIHSPVKLLLSDLVASPAVYGWWRPSLLLPNQMLACFTREELRQVLLHELAHIKRRDMVMHWVATMLKTLHWFNPILWYAFRRVAADREMACDELALSKATAPERKTYGETVVKLLESCARPTLSPGVVGLLEDKDHVIRRIRMIAMFQRKPAWSYWGFSLLVILGSITLTDAQPEKLGATAGETSSNSNGSLASYADAFTLSGRVRDRDSHEPIKDFRIFSGYAKGSFATLTWVQTNRFKGTNGNFTVYVNKKYGAPILQVEADGLRTGRFALSPESASNLELSLSRETSAPFRCATPSGTYVDYYTSQRVTLHLEADGSYTLSNLPENFYEKACEKGTWMWNEEDALLLFTPTNTRLRSVHGLYVNDTNSNKLVLSGYVLKRQQSTNSSDQVPQQSR
ncbi:MAG TPA: M56 family metallopeptidase, partial [Clostridia bacterium]|nr:M56 family metallopeptidase [Clostridia bacterium]